MELTFHSHLLNKDYLSAFGKYLDKIVSLRRGTKLRPSSKATYRSSITMILSTYMAHRTESDFFNGHLDDILKLERTVGNNANYSMQSCAISHFKDWLLERRPELKTHPVPHGYCSECLCGCEYCHSGGVCDGVIECFGKCNKLYSKCRMKKVRSDVEEGICQYCLDKYEPIYNIPRDYEKAKKRSRHLEYMNDHALVGRSTSAKYDTLVKNEIQKNVRWHLLSHSCDHPLCRGYCSHANKC